MRKRKDGFNGERALVLPSTIIAEMEKSVLLANLYVTDIGYYPNAKHHFRERKEPVSQYIFIYCTDGEGWVKLNGEEYKVSKNQYFILPANIPHSYGASVNEPWTIYWIHFKGKVAGEYSQGLAAATDVKPNPYSRISERIDLFEEMFHTLEMGYSMENLLYSSSVFYHFLASLRYIQQYRNANSYDASEYDIVTSAIHYMRENIERKLSLAELAKHLGYSPSHFSYIFNNRTGYSPINYFNQLKIQKACQLLDFSDMKINQICYKIGIDDSYYFSRLFSKIMGISPLEYKKQKKG